MAVKGIRLPDFWITGRGSLSTRGFPGSLSLAAKAGGALPDHKMVEHWKWSVMRREAEPCGDGKKWWLYQAKEEKNVDSREQLGQESEAVG